MEMRLRFRERCYEAAAGMAFSRCRTTESLVPFLASSNDVKKSI